MITGLSGLADGLRVSLLVDDRWKLYLAGVKNTLILAAAACLIGIVIGVFVAIIKYYSDENAKQGRKNIVLQILSAICNIYTTVIRGTPIIIQMLILYSLAFKGGFETCIVAFGINSGAYISEIIRSGLMSIDYGQTEAGRSLGLSKTATMRFIILPQAVKNILPALFNEFIALLKETSVAGYIAVRDLTKAADGIKGRTLRTEPLFVAAAIYLVLVIGLTKLQQNFERRLSHSDRN